MTEAPIAFENSKLLPGTPVELFPASPVVGLGANRQEYAVSRDGKFLIDQAAESPSTSPIYPDFELEAEALTAKLTGRVVGNPET
jgi:hypothetical protein